MKIVNLKAENIKLVAVEISPTDNTVIVTGKNGAGKSSVLDAIWWGALRHETYSGKLIRDGQTKASIRLDLGTIIVERIFSEKGSTLKVMADNGAASSLKPCWTSFWARLLLTRSNSPA